MSRYRLELTVTDDLLARLDAARGHEPRAGFVKRLLDGALPGLEGGVPRAGRSAAATPPAESRPVSPRVPEARGWQEIEMERRRKARGGR